MNRLGGELARRPAWLTALIAVPLALALGRISTVHWKLTGDYAHTELMVRSIPRHPPLIGVAGRFGDVSQPGAHPGPSMGYLLYPLYKVFGSSSWALIVSAAALHVGAIALAVWIARRTGGPAVAVLVTVTAGVLVRAQGLDFFFAPWNVWMPFFAFLAFVLMIWAIAAGNLRWAPWAVLLGSHCAQTHISYLPLVLGLLASVTVWLAGLARWTERVTWPAFARAVAWGAGVGAVAWLPPIVDQLRHDPGNLRILYHHFSNPPAGSVGPRAGVKGVLGELDLFGTWWRGGVHDPTSRPEWLGVLAIVVLAGAGLAVAIRRRDRDVLVLQGTVGAALVIGVVSATRIVGDFYYYVIRWMWVLTALTVVASVWSLGRAATAAWPHRRAELRRIALAGAVAALVVPAALVASDAATANDRLPEDSRLVGALAHGSEAAMSTSSHYLLRWYDPVTLSGGAFGLLLQWEKDGYHVGVDAPWAAAAQRWRVVFEPAVDEVLWFVTGDENIAAFEALGFQLLTRADVRPPADQAESATLRRRIEAGLASRPELLALVDAQYGLVQLLLFHAAELPPDLIPVLQRYTDLRLPGAVLAGPPCGLLFPPRPPGPDNPAVRPECEAARPG